MKTSVKPFLLLLLLFLFDFLFWNEKAGINLLIFSIAAIAVLFYSMRHVRHHPFAWIVLTSAISACALVAFTNTGLSVVTAFVMLSIAFAFAHQVSLRSVPYALAYITMNIFKSPLKILSAMKSFVKQSPKAYRLFRYHKLIYFPAIVTLIFLVVYSLGDPQFASSLQIVFDWIMDQMQWLLQFFTVEHFLFLCFGSLLIAAALIPSSATLLVDNELRKSNFLQRKRKTISKPLINSSPTIDEISLSEFFFRKKNLGLKREYHKGIITLALVNLLLAFVNSVDVMKVWIERQNELVISENWKDNAVLRSQAVHEGTNALIFSIVLAMLLLLFFFRGNINFLKKNKLLKQLSYIWIFQNMLLIATVVIRNCYYINDCGLTMKRIGVFAFLLATLFGLITFFLKIRDKRSSFYLIRMNSWAVCGVFLILSCVDWDPVIASYNINNLPANKLDKQYLLWLSDHALPVLIQHEEIFVNEETTPDKKNLKLSMMQGRVETFIRDYESHSWRSWNYADYHVYNFIKQQNQPVWK